ncbi:hypothetical protein RGQ29_007653 [Quercus rubra]|uniref:NYN domain-containing protein n=1 Tax=Quercus rubra TaxID=3512 RepID=A0AAN7DY56_QUERU|nr:hypothetical protein RGQ29_007653 [Quercus rubra]
MVVLLKFGELFCTTQLKTLQILNPFTSLSRFCHFESKPGFNSWDPSLPLRPKITKNNVIHGGICKSSRVTHVPQVVREQRKGRKILNQLENRGVIKISNEKLVNHFKQIHKQSARGKMRVKLVAKYSMKMEKYKNAVRDVLTLKVGYGLADELKRVGFWVHTVSNKPQAADVALKNHMVDMMDRRRVECMVLVSDDSNFVDVLKEAKLRCLKTVVVGDMNDGALKRVADARFSWCEILMGKAKKEAELVVGKWKDRDILKRLEWTYNPEVEKKGNDLEDEVVEETQNVDFEGNVNGVVDDNIKEDGKSWWELDSNGDVSSQSLKRLDMT